MKKIVTQNQKFSKQGGFVTLATPRLVHFVSLGAPPPPSKNTQLRACVLS